MTDSDTRVETWKAIPRFGRYEASDLGQIRNLKGIVLKTRLSNRGYPQLNLTDDEGRVRTVTVHTMVLLTFAGPCPEGMEAMHGNDVSADNRWPENLSWGTHGVNEKQKFVNGRPKPVPPNQARARAPKVCVPCEREFTGTGNRCHKCVVEIGVKAAPLLWSGKSPTQVGAELDYPSVEGVWRLAVKYGGYGRPPWRFRAARAIATLRDRLRGDRA